MTASGFTRKELRNIKMLGDNLREHRESLRLSLEKASRLINVETKYLEALENNDFKNLPPDAYAQNFLKKYAEILGLNPSTAVTLFKKEKAIFDCTQKKVKKINKLKNVLHFIISPSFLRGTLLVIIALGILTYLGIKIYNITEPPQLIINNLPTTFSTTEKSVSLTGKSESEALIEINDRQIVSDKNGNFNLTLDLQKGLNIIKISAKNKHSRANVLYYQILQQ